MGLDNEQKSLLNSKEARNEMLTSIVLIDLLPRLYFLTYDDIQLIESKVTNSNKIVVLSHLLEKRLSSLSEFVEILLQWNERYSKLVSLLGGQKPDDSISKAKQEYQQPKEQYLCKYTGKEMDPSDSNLWTLIEKALKKKVAIYALAPYVFYFRHYHSIVAVDHPELEKYEFPQIGSFQINAQLLWVDEKVLLYFLTHVASKLPVLDSRDEPSLMVVYLSNSSQSELHQYDVEKPPAEEPKPIDSLFVALKALEKSENVLYLAPILKLMSSYFAFSGVCISNEDEDDEESSEEEEEEDGDDTEEEESVEELLAQLLELSTEVKPVVADVPEILTIKNFFKHVRTIRFLKVELRDENDGDFTQYFKRYKVLRRLYLKEVEIEPETLRLIVEALKKSRVKVLKIHSVECLQQPGVMCWLSQALKFNKSLKTLSLRHNRLTEQHLVPLFQVLPTMDLKNIDLDGNQINEETKKKFLYAAYFCQ